MCTAISFNGKNHYFGRNLDLERRYGEVVAITPRKYPFKFKSNNILDRHFAIIGMAAIIDDYPLYFDATNERGLSMAGLNFVGNAYFGSQIDNKVNIAPYELIPYLLGQYETVAECEVALKNINVVDVSFNKDYSNAELHWIIADKKESIVLECMREGMRIYKNPVGVLTNNPPFEFHLMNLNNYIGISVAEHKNTFSDRIELNNYSRGMGGIGLPGDFSSGSRFVRAAFAKLNSIIPKSDIECVSQFFHILGFVEQVEGCVKVGDAFERTQYVSCCDTERGIYYYKTYENSQISAVNMWRENLDDDKLISYELSYEQRIENMN